MECGSALHHVSNVFFSVKIKLGVRSSEISLKFQSHQGRGRGRGIIPFSIKANKCNFRRSISPLEPHSQAGKFLSTIQQNQPHILAFAATELLEELGLDRDSVIARKELNLGSSESTLHRRIAEIKEIEFEKAIEEIIYILVVHEFSKLKVPMIPRLSSPNFTSSKGKQIFEMWPSKDKELESIHSPKMFELVKEHLSKILTTPRRQEGKCNNRGKMKFSTAQISKLQLGRLYASSIMCGYFLVAASLRHKLENRIFSQVNEEDHPYAYLASSLSPGLNISMKKPKDLKDYVLGFDCNAFKLCSKLRSQAVATIIEEHSLAIFGDGDMNNLISNDGMISVSLSGLRRMMLEAIGFGTFLWNAEDFVDSIYQLPEYPHY